MACVIAASTFTLTLDVNFEVMSALTLLQLPKGVVKRKIKFSRIYKIVTKAVLMSKE